MIPENLLFWIAPIAESIEHEEPWLTLHGLRLIWEKNQSRD